MAVAPIVSKKKTVVESKTGESTIKVEPPQETYETEKMIVKDRRIIWYIWLVIEIILLLRFLTKLFGPNPSNGFNILITILSAPFTFLFNDLFPLSLLDGRKVIEWSTLFAMVVYLFLAIIFSRFFKLKKPIDPLEAEKKSK
ncbi:MAG: hypothetical protein HYW86_01020 [Candidatus Roizmanbacteria bacterium]|nr:MAG: hypothetical protein HYW86_01020 [Candidatus Roizmanbacteria bacterium]